MFVSSFVLFVFVSPFDQQHDDSRDDAIGKGDDDDFKCHCFFGLNDC